MNQFLVLKHYRYIIRKICRQAYKLHRNENSSYIKLSGIEKGKGLNLNYVSFTYSYQQIRNYAKKRKDPKGGKAKIMQLSDEEMAEVIDVEDYRLQLNQVVEKLKKEYIEHLSIRSAVGNIENIVVKVSDEEYPLHELAVISKKNPNHIAINMSDFPEGLKPAIQAILDSGSGFNPQQEGTMIYVSVPKMTREHREKLAKIAKVVFTKSKDTVRLIQNSFVKDAKEKTGLSEDLVFSATSQIMVMAEQCVAELEKIMKIKQKELVGDTEK